MNKAFPWTVLPVLAAPWQQRRNTGSMWGVAVVAGMLALAPAVLFGWSLYMQWGWATSPAGAAPLAVIAGEIRHTAANAALGALAAGLLAAWATLVSSLLEQNRPVLARLVPHHPARLRAALLLAWGAGVAGITLLIGLRFDAPLAWATVAAVGLAILAVSVRWPMLWLLGCVAPLPVSAAMKWPGLRHAIEVAGALWREQSATLALTLAAASAVLLVALIQNGGPGHVASDAVRRRRVERFIMRSQGGQPVAEGKRGLLDTLLTRPYYLWWRRVLARTASPVFPRLMLGLGPGAHWTAGATSVLGCALGLLAVSLVLEIVGWVYAPAAELVPDMLASFSIGIVIALLSPVIQVHARLHQSRREQALLVLLPRMPRGAELNRRLAWQFTGQFLATWVGALAVAALSLVVARALRPDAVRPQLLDLALLFGVSALPMVVVQWRAWSRVSAPSGLGSIGPLLLAGLAGLVIGGLPSLGWGSHAGMAGLCLVATVAWCAMRWRRMGREPSALPIGRRA